MASPVMAPQSSHWTEQKGEVVRSVATDVDRFSGSKAGVHTRRYRLTLLGSLLSIEKHWKSLCGVFVEIFLPTGFPHTVCADYLPYQANTHSAHTHTHTHAREGACNECVSASACFVCVRMCVCVCVCHKGVGFVPGVLFHCDGFAGVTVSAAYRGCGGRCGHCLERRTGVGHEGRIRHGGQDRILRAGGAGWGSHTQTLYLLWQPGGQRRQTDRQTGVCVFVSVCVCVCVCVWSAVVQPAGSQCQNMAVCVCTSRKKAGSEAARDQCLTSVCVFRFMADILNDAGMTLELLTPPRTSPLFLPTLCVATLCRAVCGVAGGATRAALTLHFSVADNAAGQPEGWMEGWREGGREGWIEMLMCVCVCMYVCVCVCVCMCVCLCEDVSAKDGSQETLVNLLGMIVGTNGAHT